MSQLDFWTRISGRDWCALMPTCAENRGMPYSREMHGDTLVIHVAKITDVATFLWFSVPEINKEGESACWTKRSRSY